jgi:hypothetical protein
MSRKPCYIFSTEDDKQYVEHLQLVAQHLRDTPIAYRVGRDGNCRLEEICSDDAWRGSILVRSYEAVPHYQKVEQTFYWISPKYNAHFFGNKIIATHSRLDEDETKRLIQNFIRPCFNDTLSANMKRWEDLKNHACYNNRVSVFLK